MSTESDSRRVGWSAAAAVLMLAAAPAYAEAAARTFEIYGFAQADYIQDIEGRLDPDWDAAVRSQFTVKYDLGVKL